ncbi:MAG: hypothetical protein IT289_08330 [Oligoflexia bacterium]|nr:hypothetical protein [Oligoflexia bacterium]
MKSWLGAAACLFVQSIAFGHGQPPSFSMGSGNAIFVDIVNVQDEIQVDHKQSKLFYQSTIDFEALEHGFPIFDVEKDPTEVIMDGVPTTQALIKDPTDETKLRIAMQSVAPGRHQMIIKGEIKGAAMGSSGINWLWTMNDLTDRGFLERYLPANFEFDQAPRTLVFKFVRDSHKLNQRIVTNGTVTWLSQDTLQIRFPEYFTSSSFYLHMYVEGRFTELKSQFKTKDGRTVPVLVYSSAAGIVGKFETQAHVSLQDLERRFGTWKHDQVIIYAQEDVSGGMEYAGATVTDFNSLNHELIHSYFARGIMPANGNSGWIDEAITTWADHGSNSADSIGVVGTGMASHSPYFRQTDRKAYTSGARFIRYLDHLFKPFGGMDGALRELLKFRLFNTITTESFRSDLETISGLPLKSHFDQAVMGSPKSSNLSKTRYPNPHHMSVTPDRAQKLFQ